MDTVKGSVTLYGADGQAVTKDLPAVPLPSDDARVFRAFKKLLVKYQLQHNFKCAKCSTNRNGQPGYLDWTIGPDKIILMCGCRQIVFLGQTL
jgi:hypothetical protein